MFKHVTVERGSQLNEKLSKEEEIVFNHEEVIHLSKSSQPKRCIENAINAANFSFILYVLITY